MKAFDRDLGAIENAYRKAGVLKQTLFVITADHGMAPTSHFVSRNIVSRAVSGAGTTAPAVTAATAIYVWLRNAHRARAVAEGIMAQRDPGIGATYYLTGSGRSLHYVKSSTTAISTEADAANVYLLKTLMNGHEPAVVAFCRPGYTGAEPTTHWRADHGGSDWPSQHIPLIIAGPHIRPGLVISGSAQLEDVAPTALSAMGVLPVGMEGKILTEVLDNSSPADGQARSAELERIGPIVEALKGQAPGMAAGGK
ncbi:MAG: hypothetical protein NVSMB52_13750 [Chloroflexota bacterium]